MVKCVLFVCTGNTCRSSMAEALLRKMLTEDFGEKAAKIHVVSAGTGAVNGDIASPNAIEVMEREGIDLHNHRARRVSAELVSTADLVLTITLEQKKEVLRLLPGSSNKIFTLAEFTAGVRELEGLIDKAESLRRTLEQKRNKFLEREGPKLEELRHRNLELSRQMRALDEELSKIEQQMDQETITEKRELEQVQAKLKELEIADPFGKNIDAYKICAAQIKEKLKTVVKRLKESLEE